MPRARPRSKASPEKRWRSKIRERTVKIGRYAGSPAEAIDAAVGVAQDGDMILTLGAGSVSQFGPSIVEKLKEREAVSIQG